MKLFVFLLLSSVAFSQELTLVVYKKEYRMEIWEKGNITFVYRICALSGDMGPKRTQGDLQVPEGIYKVIAFNPKSKFDLSFKINYPNSSDKILGKHPLGGDIFFHGKCASIGCISFRTQEIMLLYPLVKSYKKVNVLIFPTKYFSELPNNEHKAFWENLKTVHDFWVENHTVPNFIVDSQGRYIIN